MLPLLVSGGPHCGVGTLEDAMRVCLSNLLMRREPPSRQRSVALAGIHVDIPIDVLIVAVDDALAVERAVLV